MLQDPMPSHWEKEWGEATFAGHPWHAHPATAQAWMGVSFAESLGIGKDGLPGSTSAADKKDSVPKI